MFDFKSRQFQRKKTLLIALVAILIALSLGFFGYKLFTENKITRFNVETSNLNCTNSDEVTKYLKGLNMNYFYFKSETLDADLKRKYFCIGKIEQIISYPDRLDLRINGREAKFVVKTINTDVETNPQVILTLEQMNATQSTTQAFPPKVLSQILDTYKEASSGAMYLVDNDGMVFEETSSDVAFPKLSLFSKQLRIGQAIPDDLIKKVAQIYEKLNEFGTSSDNLIVVGDRLIIDSTPRITFALNRDIIRQAASLQLILRQAKMNQDPAEPDSRSVESIDLRFDRPVIVYKK